MRYVFRLIGLSGWAPGWLPTLLLLAPLCAAAADTDALTAVQVLRMGGCGGRVPATPPLRVDPALDRAAAQWAAGATPAAAAHSNGYAAQTLSAVRVSGADAALLQELRRSSCNTITDRGVHDVGVFHRGLETWLLLGSRQVSRPVSAAVTAKSPLPLQPSPPTQPTAPTQPTPVMQPASARPPMSAARALELVNDIRAKGARCGNRAFAPVAPVKLSSTLSSVALGHAADMAQHNYFEHEDLSGHTPADRVRAVGYAEKLVGENIAYGPESADEVVQGWLDSPGHCENIMDPRFAEMGIAFSAGRASRRGLYWVQLLVAPKA
jgi:uncharacterized protein YkwD